MPLMCQHFHLNFSDNKDPFVISDIDQPNYDTFWTHNPCANVSDPNYFSNRFPNAENVLFLWKVHSV